MNKRERLTQDIGERIDLDKIHNELAKLLIEYKLSYITIKVEREGDNANLDVHADIFELMDDKNLLHQPEM